MVDIIYRGMRSNINDAGVVGTASFTPAAASYSAGTVIDVAKAFTFTLEDGSAIPNGSLIRILTTVLKIDATAIISNETSYTLRLYSVTPPSAQADQAAWTLASADLPSYRGKLDLGTPVDEGAACYIKTQQTDIQDFNLTTNALYGRLVTVGNPTLVAVARQVHLYGILL